MSLKITPISKSSKIKIGITIGDPSGIGPAITAKAVKKLAFLADFTVIGDKQVFNRLLPAAYRIPRIDFVDLKNVSSKNFRQGKVKAEYGRASIEYLDTALELIREKRIDCLVTGPISKEAINLAGMKYSGHTEYFIRRTKTRHVVMMLLNRLLRVSLITRHIPLRSVPQELSRDKICQDILLTYQSLKELFLIPDPKMVVCGLNPHASDNGLLGTEELRIICPALRSLKGVLGSCVDGPKPADVAMFEASQGRYDCAIAMYHDQALIPLKLLDAKTGVNITLGLPFIRTSPLHGTAFDIANRFSLADPASLIEAIRLALKCTLNQRKA